MKNNTSGFLKRAHFPQANLCLGRDYKQEVRHNGWSHRGKVEKAKKEGYSPLWWVGQPYSLGVGLIFGRSLKLLMILWHGWVCVRGGGLSTVVTTEGGLAVALHCLLGGQDERRQARQGLSQLEERMLPKKQDDRFKEVSLKTSNQSCAKRNPVFPPPSWHEMTMTSPWPSLWEHLHSSQSWALRLAGQHSPAAVPCRRPSSRHPSPNSGSGNPGRWGTASQGSAAPGYR